MWIVNQDRDELINSDRVKNIFINKLIKLTNPKYEIKADETTLGVYTSEENANKVLNYILYCLCSGKKEMNIAIEENGELLK